MYMTLPIKVESFTKFNYIYQEKYSNDIESKEGRSLRSYLSS